MTESQKRMKKHPVSLQKVERDVYIWYVFNSEVGNQKSENDFWDSPIKIWNVLI